MSEIKILKTILLVLVVVLTVWFVYAVVGILMPFILSAVFAYVLSPLIIRLQMIGLKRSVAVFVLYLSFISIFAGSIVILLPKAIDEFSVLRTNMPVQVGNVQAVFVNIQKDLENRFPELKNKNIVQTGIDKAKNFASSELEQIPTLLMNMFSIFSLIVLIPIITFFLLMDGRDSVDRFIDFIPSKHTEAVVGFICEVDEIIGKFIRGQVIEAISVGVLTMAGLLILKVDYAVIIGLFTGLMNMVPYLGPIAGAIPAIIVAFIKFQNLSIVFSVIIMFAIVQFIDNNFIQPIVISKGVNLGPLTMIFSIMAGAQVFGVMGMLFAIPVAGILKTLFQLFLPKLRIWLSH